MRVAARRGGQRDAADLRVGHHWRGGSRGHSPRHRLRRLEEGHALPVHSQDSCK